MKMIQNIAERVKSPTPKFFKLLRTVGLVLAGISGSVIAAPVVLPTALVTVAGYLAVAGGVLSAVSQLTVAPSTSSGNEDEPQQPMNQAEQSEDSKINSG